MRSEPLKKVPAVSCQPDAMRQTIIATAIAVSCI
jgi:hypothetical protein